MIKRGDRITADFLNSIAQAKQPTGPGTARLGSLTLNRRMPARSTPSSPTGDGNIYGLIVKSLSWPHNDDVDTYRVRLATDATAEWVQPVDKGYSFGDLVIHLGIKYVSSLPGAYTNYDEPGTTENWVEEAEISVSKVYSDKTLSRDLRDYIPWFLVGSYVKIKLETEVWYLAETLIYCGSELVSSLRHSEEEGRARAVIV